MSFGGKRIPKDTPPIKATDVFIPFYHLLQTGCVDDKTKQFSLLPETSQFIPDYIKITTSLIPDLINRWTDQTKASISKLPEDKQWDLLINKRRIPKCNKGYFAGSIQTDGVGVSILYHVMPEDFPVKFKEFQKMTDDEKMVHLKAYAKIVKAREDAHKAKRDKKNEAQEMSDTNTVSLRIR